MSSDKQRYICNADGCQVFSSMRCPHCPSTLAQAYFCSQNCFKRSWKCHALLHSSTLNHPIDPNRNASGSVPSHFPSKSRKPIEGFKGTGKLNGSYAKLISSTASFIADTISDISLQPYELPLFSSLSPHHQIQLLSDVVIGLLDPLSPLPPDTAEHFSAFYAIFSRALDLVFDECSDQEDSTREGKLSGGKTKVGAVENRDDKSVEESGDRCEGVGSFISKADIGHTERTSNLGAAYHCENVKRCQKRNSLIEKASDKVDREALESLLSVCQTKSMERFAITLQKIQDLKPLQQSDDESEEESDTDSVYRDNEDVLFEYTWRQLLRAAVVENCHALEHVHHRNSDTEVWDFFHGVAISEARLFIDIETAAIVRGALIYNIAALKKNPLELARYKRVTEYSKHVSDDFAAAWSPAAGTFALRSLMLASYNDYELLKPEDFSDMQYLEIVAGAVEDYPEEPPPEAETANFIRDAVSLLWMELWHGVMRSSGRDYSSFHDRLEALRNLPPTPPTPKWAPALCPESVGSSEYFHPIEWLANHRAEMFQLTCLNSSCNAPIFKGGQGGEQKSFVCGNCRIACYCGAACQKAHWKIHKTVCDELRGAYP